MTTWCYPLERRVTYSYTDAKRRMEPAFTTQEVCAMINRSRVNVETALLNGQFPAPQFTYGLNERRNKYKHMWSEKDIMAVHAYYSSVHLGRPRKDGLVTPHPIPTARELRAIIRQEEPLYVRVGEDFVPTWRAPDK